ncbi:MAG: hypothetical protein F6K56_03930 [Moorea sp. SIO3G5]|nr:hypothetical protein [Moorena sp. SIO3G5]
MAFGVGWVVPVAWPFGQGSKQQPATPTNLQPTNLQPTNLQPTNLITCNRNQLIPLIATWSVKINPNITLCC